MKRPEPGWSSRYRGNVPAVPEEELQAVRVGGLHRLADVYQPHLEEEEEDEGEAEDRRT